MKAFRIGLRALPYLLAVTYATWTLFIYFFADHAWWPFYLYRLIWPVSAVWEHSLRFPVFRWLSPATGPVPTETYILFDRISGAYYLLIGTLWVWGLGAALSRLATAIFTVPPKPLPNDRNA